MHPFQTTGAGCYHYLSEPRGRQMRRREFISLLGSAAALWPICARAQMPVLGFVNSSSAQAQALAVAAYRRGLEESGFIEGKSVLIESRWANGQYNLLPELVGDLIKRKVAVIMAGGPPAAIAAKKATSTIPVVFTSGDDPVQTGLVSSINRPGGNLTGVYIFFSDVETKKLGLLRELVPNAALIAALMNPSFPTANNQTQELHKAADKLGQRIQIINASSELEIDAAFASYSRVQCSSLPTLSSPVGATRSFRSRRNMQSLPSTNSAPLRRPAD